MKEGESQNLPFFFYENTLCDRFYYDDSAGASGGYLSCFGKKDTKETDQGGAMRALPVAEQAS